MTTFDFNPARHKACLDQVTSEHNDSEIEATVLPAKVEREASSEQSISSNEPKLIVEDFKTLGNSEQVILVTTKGGTAEIHVILSISHTFISKRTYNHGFPYYFSTYYHTS